MSLHSRLVRQSAPTAPTFTVEFAPLMTFQESPDYRSLLDPMVPYLVRLERVVDRETKIGEALEWTFAIHDCATGVAMLKPDSHPLTISRITSPGTGPRTRARRFIEALLGQELSKDQLKSLLQSGTLAGRLKDRKALAFIQFEEADDGAVWPRINELQRIDNGKPPPTAMPASPQSTPPSPLRSYEEVFGDGNPPSASPSAEDHTSELPF
jgi:hypothetical protein